MIGPIPFEVPAHFAAAINSGSIVRAGALLKDSGTGKIVAHLQETGLAQQLMDSAVSSPFSPLQALNTPSSLAANLQLVQLNKMVEGLQILQFANLGATAAGIGVSVIGFALMNKKLNSMQAQIAAFSDRIEERFAELKERELRVHFARVHGLFEQADQAHMLSNRSTEWQRIAGVLADEGSFFRSEIIYLTQQDVFDLDLYSTLTRSYALCNAGRIECLVQAGELPSARRVSADVAKTYNTLFDDVTPLHLAQNALRMVQTEDKSDYDLLREELPKMHTFVQGLRDSQDAALSKPYLLDTLIEQEINGYEYMRVLREEKNEPIYLLPTA